MSTLVSKTTGQGAIESLDERGKLSGRIDFKCDKFAELASAGIFSKCSEQKLCIRGLTWQMLIQKLENENSLGIFLICRKQGEIQDKAWSCSAHVTLRLHSQKEGGGRDMDMNSCEHFNPGFPKWGERGLLEIEKVLDPENGWLDKDGALHVSAEIKADEPQGVCYIRRPDVLLVDGQEVNVNKHILAANSDHFNNYYFGVDSKKNTGIDLDPPATATVDDFKRMLDTMHPDNRPLDDECIEGVFELANRFLLGEVEGKCRNFLADKSKRSIIFKFRLADKYGFQFLKKHILDSSKEEDFLKKADFKENLEEYAKLDEKAREQLGPRIDLVFGNKNVVAK